MTSKLSKEEQKQFRREVRELKEVLVSSIEFYKKNLLLFNGLETKNYTNCFLDILARIRYNLEGLSNLLSCFEEDYRLKISVSLLLRSICADQLTILYLLTFYDKEDESNIAVKNELDVISSEYLQYVKKTLREDHDLLVLLGFEKESAYSEKVIWFNKLAPELIKESGKIKTRTELRETTPNKIKEGLKPYGNFLSENEKSNRIKEFGFAKFGFIFIAFKYYSQFQHFTTMSKKIIEYSPLYDTYYMALTLDHMLITTDIALKFVKSPNVDYGEEITIIRNKIVKIYP